MLTDLAREGLQIVGRYLGEYPREDKEWLFTTLVRGNQYVGCDLRKCDYCSKSVKARKAGYNDGLYSFFPAKGSGRISVFRAKIFIERG